MCARNWLAILLLCTSLLPACSPKISQPVTPLPPMLTVGEETQKYNLQLDFMRHHFSGLLVVRQTAPKKFRLLGTTYFGLSLFDFELNPTTLQVNSCIEPLHKKNLLRLLERDFKNIFLGHNDVRMKKKNATFEERTEGKGFGKATYHLSAFTDGEPQQVRIKHGWIGLKIQLNRLNEPTN
ncbi:MAG: hypothetical protein EOM31_03070 [Bacteroidia bacterium]|nr:hypothetical protein [Bacteroidia bacterium]